MNHKKGKSCLIKFDKCYYAKCKYDQQISSPIWISLQISPFQHSTGGMQTAWVGSSGAWLPDRRLRYPPEFRDAQCEVFRWRTVAHTLSLHRTKWRFVNTSFFIWDSTILCCLMEQERSCSQKKRSRQICPNPEKQIYIRCDGDSVQHPRCMVYVHDA